MELGPCPKAALLCLGCSSRFSVSPSFRDWHVFEPALWNLGKFMEAEAYSLQIRNVGMRDSEVFLCPGALQGPAQLHPWHKKCVYYGWLLLKTLSLFKFKYFFYVCGLFPLFFLCPLYTLYLGDLINSYRFVTMYMWLIPRFHLCFRSRCVFPAASTTCIQSFVREWID